MNEKLNRYYYQKKTSKFSMYFFCQLLTFQSFVAKFRDFDAPPIFQNFE